MTVTKEDRSFKTLINKRATSSAKQFYEEAGDQTINIQNFEIWAENIAFDDPIAAMATVVAEFRSRLVLTEDTTVPAQQAWFAEDGYGRLKDWISDKNGSSFVARLFDSNNNEIFPTDQLDWFFDYTTGVLTIGGNPSGFAQPFSLDGYRYIGQKGITGSNSSSLAAIELPNIASMTTVDVSLLVVGRKFTVVSDGGGVTWEYTGQEASAPDPSNPVAWNQVGPASPAFFANAATINTTTVYWREDTGDDVFGSGTFTNPFKTITRCLSMVYDGPAPFETLTSSNRADYICEHHSSYLGKTDFSSVSVPFANNSGITIKILARRSLQDLDGYGTTSFTAGAGARDLSGPVGSGGTVTKSFQYRNDTGLNLLSNIQQPPEDGYHWLFSETDFGFPGFRSFKSGMPCQVHDTGNMLSPTDIAMCGGGFDLFLSSGSNYIVSTFIDIVDAASPFPINIKASAGVDLTFIGFDFGTDLVAQGKSNGLHSIDGNISFSACRFSLGQQNGINPGILGVTYRQGSKVSIFENCAFIGIGGGDCALTLDNPGGRVAFNKFGVWQCIFVKSALLLGEGSWEPNSCVFRGSPAPSGSNGLAARVIVGNTVFLSESGGTTGSITFRTAFDFERAPGELVPMSVDSNTGSGGCIYVVGLGNVLRYGGGQGPTTMDIDGRWLLATMGAYVGSPVGVHHLGEFGLPGRLLSGAKMFPNVSNINSSSVFTGISNYVVLGEDVQLGASTTTPQIFAFTDNPVTDFAQGDQSQGLIYR